MERNDGNPNVMYTKFLAYCADSLGQDAPKITKLLGIKYESCSKEIQNSNEMADLLGHTMENMKKEPNRAFVHLKDLVHQLKLWSKVKPVKKTQKSSTVNEGNENFQTNAMSNKDEGKRKYNFPPEDDTESKVSSPCSSSSPIKSDCKVLLVKTELVESQLETLTKKPWHSPSKSYRVSIGDGKFDQASVIHKAQKLPLDLNLQPDPEASIASPSCGSENHTQHKPSSEICFSSRQPHASFSGTMSTSPRKVSTSSSSNSEMVPRSTVILEVGSSSSEVEDIQSLSHSKPDKIDSLKSDALNSKTLESVLNPSTKHAEQTYESCKNQLVFAFDKDSVVPSTSFSNGRGVVHGNEKMLDKVEKPPENSVCLQEEPSQGTPSSGTERYRLLDHLDLSAQSPISTKGFETESCVDSCASTLDPLDVNEPDNLSPQVVEDDFPKVTTVGVCQIPDENPTLHIEQNKSNSMTQKDEPEALELDAGFNGGGSLTNPNSDWETISYGSSQVCSSDTIIDEGSITMPKDDALCGKRCESEQLMQSGDSNEKHQKETISDSGNKSNKGSKVNKPEVTNTDTDCLDQQNPSCALENEKEVSPTGIKLNSKSPAGPCKVPEEKAFAITGVQEESAEDGTCCDVDKQALNIDSDDNGKDTRCAKKTLDNSQGCHSPLTVLSEEDEDEPSRQKEESSLPVKRADKKDVNLKVAEEEKDAAVSAKLPKRAMLVPYLAKADTSVIARKLSKEKLAYRDNPKTRPLLNNSADLKIKDSTDSGAPSSGDEFVSTSKDDAREHKKVPQQKLSPEEEKHQRHVKKLEKLLESLRDEIEKCQNRELSFEDMDAEDSSYIYEDRLKKKFVTVWNKLCEVTKRTVETGRPTERTIKFNSTRYKEINRRLERFLNKTKSFPDIHDVKHVIKMTNTKYKLGLSSPMMQNIAREAFVDIGEMLQSRRHQDFIATFGTRQTDMMRMGSRGMDPYWTDPELRKKLDSNRETAKYNLEKVIAKYTQLQETKGKDDDDDDDEEEEDNDVKEAYPKKSMPSKRSHGAGSSRSMKDVSGEQDRFDDVDDEDANQGSICDSPLSSGHKVGPEASTQLRSLTSSSTASAPLTSIDSGALGPSQYLTSARLKTPAAPMFSKVYDDQDKLRLNDVPPIDVDQKQSYLDSVGLLTLSMNPYLHKTEAVSPSRTASAGRAPGQTSYSLPNSPASVITVEDSPAKPPKAKLSAVLADKDRHGELEAGVGASEVSRESGRPASSKSEWTAAGEQPLPGVRKSGHRFVEAVEEIEDQTSDSDSDDKSDNDGQDDDDDDDIITVVSSRGSGGESESETSRGVSPISVVSLDIEDGESNSPAVGSEQGTVPKQEEDLGTDNHREDGSAEKVQMLAALNLMPSPVPCRKKSAASNIESSDIAASPAARPSLEVECSDRTEGTSAERGHQSTELSQEGIVGEAASSQVDKDSVILVAANIKESDCSSEHSNAGEGQPIPKFSCSLFGKQSGGGTSHSLFQPNKNLPYPSCTKGESETTPINQCTIENDDQCGSPAEAGSEEMEMDQPECYIDRVEEEEEEEEGEGGLLTVSSGHTFSALAYAESVQEVVHIDVDDTNTLSGPEEPALLGSSTADIAEDCICLADPVEGTSTAETMQYEGREVDKKSGAGSMCAEQTCTKDAMKLKESMNNSDLLIDDQNAICCRTVISEIGNSNIHDSSSHKDLNKTKSLDSDMTETSLPIKKSTVSDPDPGVKDHTETTGSEVERVTSNCIGSYTEALHVSHNKQAPINVGSVEQETSSAAEVKCLSSTSDVTNLKPHEETENDSDVKDRKSIANSNVHSSNNDKFLAVTPNKEHSPESAASDKVGAGDTTACSAKDPEHSSLLSKPGELKEPEGDGGSDTGVTPQAGLSSRAASKGTNLKEDKLLSSDEVCNEGEILVQGKEIDSVDKTSATGSTISEAGLSLSALPEPDLEPAEKKGGSDGAREFIADLIGDLVDKVGDVCSVNLRQDASETGSDQPSHPQLIQNPGSQSAGESHTDTAGNDTSRQTAVTDGPIQNSDIADDVKTHAVVNGIQELIRDRKTSKNVGESCDGVSNSQSAGEKELSATVIASVSSNISDTATVLVGTDFVNTADSPTSDSFEKVTETSLESKYNDPPTQSTSEDEKADAKRSDDENLEEEKSRTKGTTKAEEERGNTDVFDFITEICNKMIESAAPVESDDAEKKKDETSTPGEECPQQKKRSVPVPADDSTASPSQDCDGQLDNPGIEANVDGTNSHDKKEGDTAETSASSSESPESEDVTIIEELSDAKGVRVSSRSKEEDREMIDALLTAISPDTKDKKTGMGSRSLAPLDQVVETDEGEKHATSAAKVSTSPDKPTGGETEAVSSGTSSKEKETAGETDASEGSSNLKESEEKTDAPSKTTDVDGGTVPSQSNCGEQLTQSRKEEPVKDPENAKSEKRKREETLLEKDSNTHNGKEDEEDDDDITITSVEPAEPPAKKKKLDVLGEASYITDIISSVYHGLVPQKENTEAAQSTAKPTSPGEDDDIIVVETSVQPSQTSRKQIVGAPASFRPSGKDRGRVATIGGQPGSSMGPRGRMDAAGRREPYTLMGKAPRQEPQMPKIITPKPYVPYSLPPNPFHERMGKGKTGGLPHQRHHSSGSRQSSFPLSASGTASKYMQWSPLSSSSLGSPNFHSSHVQRQFDSKIHTKSTDYKSNTPSPANYFGRDVNKVFNNSHIRKNGSSPQQSFIGMKSQDISLQAASQVGTPYSLPRTGSHSQQHSGRAGSYSQHSAKGLVGPASSRVPSTSYPGRHTPASQQSHLSRRRTQPQYGPPPRKAQKNLDGLKIVLDENSDEEDSAQSGEQGSRKRKSSAVSVPKIVSVCSLNNPAKSVPSRSPVSSHHGKSPVGPSNPADAEQIVLSDSD